MWSDIKSSYAVGWGFALAFPLIFLIAPVVEFGQHIVEWRIGMFDGLVQADALADHPARMAAGMVKLVALTIGGLWIARYVHSGGDRRKTAAVSTASMLAFIPVVLVFMALEYGAGRLTPWIDVDSLGPTGSIAANVGVFLVSSVLQVLLAGWRIGVPLRDRQTGVFTSIWRGLLVLGPGLTLYLAVFLPLLVIHTALNVGMVFAGPGPLLWVLFVIDSLIVGFIVTALWSVFHAIYRRGRARVGLAPVSI